MRRKLSLGNGLPPGYLLIHFSTLSTYVWFVIESNALVLVGLATSGVEVIAIVAGIPAHVRPNVFAQITWLFG